MTQKKFNNDNAQKNMLSNIIVRFLYTVYMIYIIYKTKFF